MIIGNSIGECSKKEIGLYIKLSQYEIHSKKSRETKVKKPEETGFELFRQLREKKKKIEELILVKCQVSIFKSQDSAILKAKKYLPAPYGASSILK